MAIVVGVAFFLSRLTKKVMGNKKRERETARFRNRKIKLVEAKVEEIGHRCRPSAPESITKIRMQK